jgi:dolichyl-phosphate-mannose-protein mannosyltransferase
MALQSTETVQDSTNSDTTSWYGWGLGLIFAGSLLVRFWGLERFNTLVFDEVYYARFANNYLTQTPFFDGHPPLSKYIIAVGMWLGNLLPIGHAVANDLPGSLRTTWSYRWLNALTGAGIPIVVASLVQQVSLNRRLALIAGFLAAMDGLFLVESRYALNNVYLVIFGLLGQVLLLLAARLVQRSWRFWLYLIGSGSFFAASAAIKWNGLWFLLGALGCLGLAWGLQLMRRWQPRPDRVELPTVMTALGRIDPIAAGLCLGILPLFVYAAIWIPHLQMNPTETFWGLQAKILNYHQGVKAGTDVHPYCSTWDSWLLMRRPVAYFYKIGIDPQVMIPLNAPPLPTAPDAPIYDVHAMGNPILWWASTAAIGTLLLTTLAQLWQWLMSGLTGEKADQNEPIMSKPEFWLGSFCLVNYGANLLPWIPVSRCIFLYHYMGASVFAGIALAWWCDRAWADVRWRWVVQVLLGLIGAAFVFWLPIYLGLPLSPGDYKLRMWFDSWV